MGAINKILIIRLSSVGDIVLASPLIRVLRTALPNAQIDFLVKSEYADLVRFNPHLSSIIELRSNDKEELRDLKEFIRSIHYDVILDIHNSLRSRYLRSFSRAKHKIVVNKRAFKRFLLVKFKWNFYKNIIPVADRYLETVTKLGIKNDEQGLDIFIPDETASIVKTTMDKFRLDKYGVILGIAPTARHCTKRWLPERFVEFGVEFAKKTNTKILIFGSKEERDECSDIAQMMNARAGGSIAESLAGKLTLLETAAALDYCDIVVANDSGLTHAAAARKRKVVVIFGSTVREFGFFPYKVEHRVVEIKGLPCKPCSHIGLDLCPRNHFRCMKDIQVDDLLGAVNDLLVS